MRTLALDPCSGASGDMLLGALFDLGVPVDAVAGDVSRVVPVDLEVRRAHVGGIACLRVEVRPRGKSPRDAAGVLDAIENAELPAEVAGDAADVFRLLAEAEGAVHGIPAEDVHFHEVADSVGDVVGVCSAVRRLDVERVYCTPVGVGGGTVQAAHGTLPVPAPATTELLRRSRLAWRGGPSAHELLTPTGAALLARLVTHPVEFLPRMHVGAVGYGGGARETPHPNVLRAMLGETDEASALDASRRLARDRVTVLETHIDHAGGEVLAHTAARLMEAGALDVALLPATMKKGRPGVVVSVVVPPERAAELARLLVEETGTLGVRVRDAERLVAARETLEVELMLGGATYRIGVKVARDAEGALLDVSAEYEDCRQVAAESGLTLREVARRAEEIARRTLGGES